MANVKQTTDAGILDLVIVGAGLSGIGAACHYAQKCGGSNFAILEGRSRMGGTWDLFQYPGIRSDSDMYTLGYDFKPWTNAKAIADGPSILEYIHETAREYNVNKKIRYNHRVTAINWSSETQYWTLEIMGEDGEKRPSVKARFISLCPGYYRYDKGFLPDFEGQDDFDGPRIHPQHWPEDFDYTGKNIVVIGSGATAVTLVPQLAKKAAHVTMLQRSPTYIATMPDEDRIANFLRRVLPTQWAYKITRMKNILMSRYIYNKAMKKPEKVKTYLLDQIQKELGPDYDVGTHFTPTYNPWDQRLCLVPNSDMFHAIRDGKASVVTDHIERFTKTGIDLKSGSNVPADVIVTATGIDIVFMGGMTISVDGVLQDMSKSFGYKGMMFSNIPNVVSVFGYTNASWTLRADLISHYMCRLLNYMSENDIAVVTPRAPDGMTPQPWINFQAGYLLRVVDELPKQGDRQPWLNRQDYKFDKKFIGTAPIADEALEFIHKTPHLQKAS